jgi:hypothetical protein
MDRADAGASPFPGAALGADAELMAGVARWEGSALETPPYYFSCGAVPKRRLPKVSAFPYGPLTNSYELISKMACCGNLEPPQNFLFVGVRPGSPPFLPNSWRKGLIPSSLRLRHPR